MTTVHARFNLDYPNFALDVDLDLPGRGITALFGPSGSGKTTLLRCIAGLERVAGGLLRVHGEVWQDGTMFRPVHSRRLGYVFQEASLFPYLSVRRNLEYGLRRVPRAERKVQLEQVVEWLGLNKLMDRDDPSGLSGGERQRVAIGRALLTSPSLLLMDEPLSALDLASKQEIFPFLERLHDELDFPVFYVSHMLDEVTRLADHLVLLEQGRVIASGALGETLSRLDLPTARQDDAGVVIEARVAEHDETYQLSRLDFPGGSLWVGKVPRGTGALVRARVLARDVSIAIVPPQGTSISNILSARIAEIRYEGRDRASLRLAVGDRQMLMSRITRRSCDLLGLANDMQVFAQVKSVALIA
ncbi:MAG TPA: molybdenum ABC transporter ATP-binding protein [Gallionella sp.]|nr:molybdenum ABC transporter ATP-binding protein [Gallionella sp.]